MCLSTINILTEYKHMSYQIKVSKGLTSRRGRKPIQSKPSENGTFHAHEVLASRTLFMVRCIATASINMNWDNGRKCCQL